MNGTTGPTGSSNRIGVTRTNEDIKDLFRFELNQMDFEVDNVRNKEKEGEAGSTSGNTSGNEGNNSTPIIPGNHQNLNGLVYANAITTQGLYIAKPVLTVKGKEGKVGKIGKEENEGQVKE